MLQCRDNKACLLCCVSLRVFRIRQGSLSGFAVFGACLAACCVHAVAPSFALAFLHVHRACAWHHQVPRDPKPVHFAESSKAETKWVRGCNHAWCFLFVLRPTKHREVASALAVVCFIADAVICAPFSRVTHTTIMPSFFRLILDTISSIIFITCSPKSVPCGFV